MANHHALNSVCLQLPAGSELGDARGHRMGSMGWFYFEHHQYRHRALTRGAQNRRIAAPVSVTVNCALDIRLHSTRSPDPSNPVPSGRCVHVYIQAGLLRSDYVAILWRVVPLFDQKHLFDTNPSPTCKRTSCFKSLRRNMPNTPSRLPTKRVGPNNNH